MLRCLGLELLEPVGEVGALAPHLLETVRDLLEQLVDRLSPVTAQPCPVEIDVSDFHGCERHVTSLQETPDQGIDDLCRNDQDDDGHDRGKIDWPERRNPAAKQADVRACYFRQESLQR